MKYKCIIFLVMGLCMVLAGCQTMTPLSKASRRGDIKEMNMLITGGANVNEPAEKTHKATALHWASANGQAAAVKRLIEAGADVNSLDYCRQTPVFYAISGATIQSPEIVKLLITKGADLSVEDCHGRTPIDYAGENQNKPVIDIITSSHPASADRLRKALIAARSHLNLPTSITTCRMTQVHAAAKKHNLEALKKNAVEGTDLDEADCYGWRARDYAKGYPEMEEWLAARSPASKKGDHNFPPKVRWEDTVNFVNAVPQIAYRCPGKLAVLVLDQRKYVLKREKQPEYVGYTRHNAYGPSDMITRDRKPYAHALASLIAEGYRMSGGSVVDMGYGVGSDLPLKSENSREKPHRILALRINELITETQYFIGHVDLKYDIAVIVADETGKEIVVKNFSGTELIGTDKSSPSPRTLVVLPEVLYYLLTNILNQPDIKTALL